jgi:outer membrane protein
MMWMEKGNSNMRNGTRGSRVFAGAIPTVAMAVLTTAAWSQQVPPAASRTVPTEVPPPVKSAVVPLPSDVASRPLSASEAARIAVTKQPTIEAARLAIEAAKARTQQIKSGVLPSVSLTGQYYDVESLNTVNGVSSATAAAPVPPGYVATATVKQLLFDFAHTRNLVNQSTSLEKSAQDNLLRTRFDLVFQTTQAFYQYSVALKNEKIANDSLNSRQKQLALARARLKSGFGLPSDVARAETSSAQGVNALISARNVSEASRINLALIMGIDPRTPISIDMANAQPIAATDINRLVTDALRQRPEILIAEDNIKSAKYGVNAARSTNAPTVSANVEVSSRGNTFPPGGDTFVVGVSVNWNPFDGGFTPGKIKEAQANHMTAIAAKESTRLSIISDVTTSYSLMRTAEQRLTAAANEVANARELLRIAEGRFASGLGIFLDIVDAETALETAESDLTSAELNANVARAALAHAVGMPM